MPHTSTIIPFTPLEHREKTRVGLEFLYDEALIAEVKQLPGARCSPRHKLLNVLSKGDPVPAKNGSRKLNHFLMSCNNNNFFYKNIPEDSQAYTTLLAL